MKSINELERAKKDKIRGLSVTEAERYINNLNKEMADAWGNIDNSFSIDIKTMMRNSALCDEAVEILSDKYRMELMVATSRLNALIEKHAADIDDIHELILKTGLHGLISSYWQTSHNMLILNQFLNILYQHYWISPADLEEYIEMTNPDEDDDKNTELILKISDIPVYDLYRQHFMNSLEFNIKHMVSIIDIEIVILKRLIHFQFKEDDDPDNNDENTNISTGTYYDEFKDGMLEYQKLSQDLIAEYEELKLDGFHNAKSIEAEILADNLDMEVDFFNDLFKKNRPSYDLHNMVFIPPKEHIASMKEHPEWKSNGHKVEDAAAYDDKGMDEFYAIVTKMMP